MSELTDFFVDIWDDREDMEGSILCYESGKKMNRSRYRMNSAVYSHILPKQMFPEYKFKKWNLKIVLPEWHSQFSINPEMAPKQYTLYLKLLADHHKGILK